MEIWIPAPGKAMDPGKIDKKTVGKTIGTTNLQPQMQVVEDTEINFLKYIGFNTTLCTLIL